MVKISRIITSLLLLSLANISICQYKAVIFDLHGVLFEKKEAILPYVNKLGLLTIGSYILWRNKRPADLKRSLFTSLKRISPVSNESYCIPQDNDGNELPEIMVKWLQGKVDGQTIITAINNDTIHNSVHFSSQTERTLVNRLADTIFNPQSFASLQQLHPHAHETVSELKNKGYKVYILSNWDKESFEFIRTRYADFFDLFDGMIISGHVGCAKPDGSIYECMLKQAGLMPHECIFIDDQTINVKQAKQMGIDSLLCPQKKGWFSKSPNLKLILRRIFKRAERSKVNQVTSDIAPHSSAVSSS